MALEGPLNASDEKDASDDSDMKVIQRVLDEMIESHLKMTCQNELVCISDSKCWKETGIRLLSNSTSRIFGSEINECIGSPPRKRRKNGKNAVMNSNWNSERSKIRAVVVNVDFIQKFK